jgi:uncharacterized membrane protein YbhN (UPF0104 family)
MPQLARLARLSRNRWLHLAVGALASMALVWVAARTLAWREVFTAFGDISLPLLLLSMVPVGVALVLRAGRWHVVMPGVGARFHQTFLTQNAGIGLNNVLPIRMMSEPVQLALITRRYGVPFPTALAGLVAGNALDVFATGILMGLGVLLVPGMRAMRLSIPLAGAVGMLVVTILVLLAVSRGLDAVPGVGRVPFFVRLTEATRMLRHRPRLLGTSFVATLAFWLCMGVAGWLAARPLGVSISPITLAIVMAASTFFVSAVPSLPGGIGTFHFAAMSMLQPLGVDPAPAFTLAVVFHLQIVLPPLLIAAGVFARMGMPFSAPVQAAAPPGADGRA